MQLILAHGLDEDVKGAERMESLSQVISPLFESTAPHLSTPVYSHFCKTHSGVYPWSETLKKSLFSKIQNLTIEFQVILARLISS